MTAISDWLLFIMYIGSHKTIAYHTEVGWRIYVSVT